MRKSYLFHAGVLALALLQSGCGSVDLSQVTLQQAKANGATTCTRAGVDELTASASAVTAIENARLKLPSVIRDHPVILAVYRSAQSSAAGAITHYHDLVIDYRQRSEGGLSVSALANRASEFKTLQSNDATASASIQTPPTLSRSDFEDLAGILSDHLLRETNGSAEATGDAQFWALLKEYYVLYDQGKFVDYFGNPYGKPSLSTTISDTELANAIGVLFEYIFDQASDTTVWVKGTGTSAVYYPGGTSSEPSYDTIRKITATSIDGNSDTGCGMTPLKAEVMSLLAHDFASAAANGAGLAVGTLGGVEIGLGVLGKVNIGDNKALTSVVQASVAEAVQRLTVITTRPILENIQLSATDTHDSVTRLFQASATQ